MRNRLMYDNHWKTKYLNEPPIEGDGSGSGSGNTPPVVPPVNDSVPKAEFDKLKQQFEEQSNNMSNMQQFVQSVSPLLEKKGDGTWGVKNSKVEEPSEAEIAAQETATKTSMYIHSLNEKSVLAMENVITEMRAKDPLFEDNMVRAKTIMKDVALASRSEDAWKRAYALARGENHEKYEKMYRTDESNKTKAELKRSQGAAMIVSGSGSDSTEVEVNEAVKNFAWSPRLIREADVQIANGLVTNREEYAKLYVENDRRNGGGE